MKQRCKWVNLNNPLYIKYHDEVWGRKTKADKTLFEYLVLESFQAGLSWETILNKKEAFKKAFDNYDYFKIANYNEAKINELMSNKDIIRNHLKIKATINNAQVFIKIIQKHQSFNKYLESFTKRKNIYEVGLTKSELSEEIALALKKAGMKFLGPTIVYSYLQALGYVNSHEKDCYLYERKDHD